VNPVDSLPVIAEISLGLVGFTAIVTILRPPDRGLVGLDLVRSLYLLAYASASLLLALLPSLLTAMGCEPGVTWRLCSATMLVCSLVGFVYNRQSRPRFSVESLTVSGSMLVAIWVLGSLNLVLQFANAAGLFGLPRFWPFLLGLFWYLVFCLMQFAGCLRVCCFSGRLNSRRLRRRRAR
jgi:hypothetical protein